MKNLLLIILFTATSFAQVKEEWVRYYDGPADSLDFAEYVKVDAEGNVYVGGTSADTEPYYDFVLIKYNSLGQEQWVRRVDLSNFDYLRGMTLDQEGNIILTGIIDYLSYPSTVTLKYDPQGELQWQKIFSNANNINFCNAITSDGSGNIYVSGYTNNDNDEEFLTIKYNYSGEQAWVKYYGLQGEDARAHALVVDYLGNIYVTGQTGSSQSTINDYLTIKYNSNGVEQWIKIFEGSNYAWSWGVNLDDATNIYVIGAQYDNDDNAETLILKYNYSGFLVFSQIEYGYELQVGTTTQNGDTYFAANDPNQNISTVIVKYNSEGVKQWEKTYEEPGRAMDMDTDHNGDIYVTGFVEPSGQFSKDIFTVKYSKDGVKQWDIKFGGNANLRDESRRITLDKNQNIYITGYSESRNTVDLDFLTIKYSQALRITEPQAGEKWIAGETDTIKWTGGQAEQFLSIEYSVDDGQTYNLIELAAPADSNYYVWKIPKTILSTKVKIKLTDFQTSTVLAECETFKIKPYVITRVDQNGDYIAYDINIDKWGFSNTVNDVWPRSWFQQFNYQGIDPFTNQPFPTYVGFTTAYDSIHPDWISWVNTFGINACYVDVNQALYSPTALFRWQRGNSNWNGSCFGIAISNALAFQRRNDFLARYPNFPDNFTNPIEVTSGTTVIPVINELFTHQFGNPHVNFRSSVGINKTPNQTLADLKQMLREDNVQVRTIGFLNNGLGGGGHAILGHKVERHPTFEDVYRVFVYDNSNPDSLNAFIEVDTTLNTWQTYYDWITWGGSKWFYLRDPAENYLTNSILPKENKDYQSPFILPEAALQVFIDETESILITNTQGQSIGYKNNNLITEITDAYPFILDNGSLDPPIGYELENEIYSITIDSILNESFGVAFFNSNKSFGYDRNDALQSQSDRLFFDGGVSVTNPDQQNKTIRLLNIINETTLEKLFAFSSIELSQNDSLKIENPDSNKIKLISYGTGKDYDIELNYVTENGIGRFGDFNIPLSANTSHIFVPEWTTLTNSELKVLVDVGNDGTIDDTLSLINQVTGIGDDQGSLLTPTSYNLAQNYPNPFNPITKINWQSPVGSHHTLKIYDVLGNEVATLVDEFREAGRYEIIFDASDLSSGIYLYRLQAGSFTETKKMILIR